MIPLLERWPVLATQAGLPAHRAFASLPTPLEHAAALGEAIGCPALYIKRDDQTGEEYGGNKVRKLEFLLAEAHLQEARTVLTFGAAGSNHCLATAIYARRLGLRCIAMLVPQHNARSVRSNLLWAHAVGSELDLRLGKARIATGVLGHFRREWSAHGVFPSVLPPGGSSPLGCFGYVNAALEIARQVEEGRMPMPDALYVASGTMGTCVGLLVGFQLAGIKTRIEAIAVTKPPYTDEKKAVRLHRAVMHELASRAPEISPLDFPHDQFRLRHDHLGEDYALYTQEAINAKELAQTQAGLRFEGVYTGKAFAAVVADGKAGHLRDKTVLFLNTYNAVQPPANVQQSDYHHLPPALHRFFEDDVQPLDREA